MTSPLAAQDRYRRSADGSPTRDRSQAGPSNDTQEAEGSTAASRTPRTMSQVLKAQALTDLGDSRKRARRGGDHHRRKGT
jgi:hypothetical protein